MANFPARPNWRHKRPAPRKAAGAPPRMTDNITWSRTVDPREKYRIVYRDADGATSDRLIELQKIGEFSGNTFLGVMHAGKFKTLRADRVVSVIEQLTPNHEPSIRAWPTYSTQLPAFPITAAIYKIPTTAVSNRTWTVDLNHYTCTCPEKRIRAGAGYDPGQLGAVCDHMAKAITANLPPNTPGWTSELVAFLTNPRLIHIDNLT